MKKLGAILLIVVVIWQSLHLFFDFTGIRLDVYLFYDYKRLVANILFETNLYFSIIVFNFLLWYETGNKYYLVFLLWNIFNLVMYFLIFGQGTNLIGLPLLFIGLLWVKLKK